MTDEMVKPLEKILVPMDFSEASMAALQFAKRIAIGNGSSLHLLHVDDEPVLMHKTTGQSYRDAYEDKMAMKFVQLMSPEQREQFRVVMSVETGTAYHQIEQYINGHDIDLIVMGRVGRSAISSVLLGSVSAHVVKHACCPVLTVRCHRKGRQA